MTDAGSFRNIVDLYTKHGWLLRRVLLSPDRRQSVDAGIYPNVEVCDAPLDMAWFSRAPAAGEIAWELRYLGEPPISIVEYFDESSPDFTARRAAAEQGMIERIVSRGPS